MVTKDPHLDKLHADFILEHIPHIVGVIRSLKKAGKIPAHIDEDDYVSHGIAGLMEGVHKYDHQKAVTSNPDHPNPFLKYATSRIRGRILDAAKQELSQHVPPSIQEAAKKFKTPAPEAPAPTEPSKPEEPK